MYFCIYIETSSSRNMLPSLGRSWKTKFCRDRNIQLTYTLGGIFQKWRASRNPNLVASFCFILHPPAAFHFPSCCLLDANINKSSQLSLHTSCKATNRIMTDDRAPDAPANANAKCVGPTSASAGKADACEGCPNKGACSSGAFSSPEAIAKAQAETAKLKSSLENVSHTILVLSGKGGVEKTTVAHLSTSSLSEIISKVSVASFEIYPVY